MAWRCGQSVGESMSTTAFALRLISMRDALGVLRLYPAEVFSVVAECCKMLALATCTARYCFIHRSLSNFVELPTLRIANAELHWRSTCCDLSTMILAVLVPISRVLQIQLAPRHVRRNGDVSRGMSIRRYGYGTCSRRWCRRRRRSYSLGLGCALHLHQRPKGVS